MFYRASVDNQSKIITAIVFLLLLHSFLEEGVSPLIFGSLIIFFTLIFSIRGYEVGHSNLIIKRLIFSKKFILKDITKIQFVEADDRVYLFRVFASGGFMGYFGLYRSKNLGYINIYATRNDHWVLIELKNKKIILSPDEPYLFIDEINQFLQNNKLS